MKNWFVIYYNGDMDRCTEHFEMEIKAGQSPTKSQIENLLNIDLGNNWNIEEVI